MATTSLQSLSYLIANLMGGRNPQLEAAPLGNDLPAPGGGGVDVTGATLALVKVSLRENPAYRTAYYVVTTTDLTATYTATVDGTAVAYNAAVGTPANLAELVADWAAAINANGTVAALVTATATDYAGDGVINAVRLVGLGVADYSVAVTVTGTAAVSLYADASGATMRLLARPNLSPSTDFVNGAARSRALGWASKPLPDGSRTVTLDRFGWLDESIVVAGLSALDVVLTDIVGDPGDALPATEYIPQSIICPKRQESSQ